MDGILDHVPWIHGLLQAAGDALHWGTATWRWVRGGIEKERESWIKGEGGMK